MNQEKSELFSILSKEDLILDEVISNQHKLRNAVNQKDWSELMTVISSINVLMDNFNRLDEKREEISVKDSKAVEECNELLTVVRGKLVKCRTENKAMSDYITITRNFVKKIIESAVPQRTNKVYSPYGIVQKQPQSVVVDTLY